jgi:hypothetical protein
MAVIPFATAGHNMIFYHDCVELIFNSTTESKLQIQVSQPYYKPHATITNMLIYQHPSHPAANSLSAVPIEPLPIAPASQGCVNHVTLE